MLAATEFSRTIQTADTVIVVAGFVLFIGWAVRAWQIRRRGGAPSVALTGLHPSAEFVLLPMLVFVMAAMLCQVMVRAMLELPEQSPEDAPLPARGLVLVTNLSMLLGAVAAYVAGRMSVTEARRSVVKGRGGMARQITMGLAGVLIALSLCQLVYMATIQLITWVAPEYDFPQHSALSALHDASGPVWMPVLVWLGTMVISPLAEELFFRGLVQDYLVRRFGRPAIGLTLTAILFGLAHASQPQVVPAITVFGLILGTLALRTGGLLAPIVAHALFNGRTLLWETMRLMDG